MKQAYWDMVHEQTSKGLVAVAFAQAARALSRTSPVRQAPTPAAPNPSSTNTEEHGQMTCLSHTAGHSRPGRGRAEPRRRPTHRRPIVLTKHRSFETQVEETAAALGEHAPQIRDSC